MNIQKDFRSGEPGMPTGVNEEIRHIMYMQDIVLAPPIFPRNPPPLGETG
jgi:hypothetical protein